LVSNAEVSALGKVVHRSPIMVSHKDLATFAFFIRNFDAIYSASLYPLFQVTDLDVEKSKVFFELVDALNKAFFVAGSKGCVATGGDGVFKGVKAGKNCGKVSHGRAPGKSRG
jgi:hypothetical protein